MKYITKYLPVEDTGEMKPGDAEGSTKIKLFLCSRDIQVGDEYYDGSKAGVKLPWINTNTRESGALKANPYDICDSESLRKHLKDKLHCFKVTGEISPDAIWVKEGMEFDEDEWRKIINRDSFKAKHYIQVKCPICGTFH